MLGARAQETSGDIHVMGGKLDFIACHELPGRDSVCSFYKGVCDHFSKAQTMSGDTYTSTISLLRNVLAGQSQWLLRMLRSCSGRSIGRSMVNPDVSRVLRLRSHKAIYRHRGIECMRSRFSSRKSSSTGQLGAHVLTPFQSCATRLVVATCLRFCFLGRREAYSKSICKRLDLYKPRTMSMTVQNNMGPITTHKCGTDSRLLVAIRKVQANLRGNAVEWAARICYWSEQLADERRLSEPRRASCVRLAVHDERAQMPAPKNQQQK
jgi:hypothetical protein